MRPGGVFALNRCPGNAGNRRRYNSFFADNRMCPRIHGKCFSRSRHYVFGDTYGCDKPGQRTVHGHMWMFYVGRTGIAGTGYAQYGEKCQLSTQRALLLVFL